MRSASRSLYLRVDVDTYVGARDGIPRLLEIFSGSDVKATFFLSLGPDRWGRAVFRIVRQPGFLSKVLRTGGVGTYRLSTCLRGTLLPPIEIAKRLGDVLREIRAAGHEVGAHCWDHVLWQDGLARMNAAEVREQVQMAVDAFQRVFDERPRIWASPAWLTTPVALEVLDEFSFSWLSNTRGSRPFLPVTDTCQLRTPEIPTTLPTLDETLGRDGVTEANYVDRLLSTAADADVCVHTIHTETEGGRYSSLLVETLIRLREEGFEILPLGALARVAFAQGTTLPEKTVVLGRVPGRSSLVTLEGIEKSA